MEKEKKKVLIVIDVQNDFVYGSLGTPEAQEIIPNIKKKFDKYKNNNDYVIWIYYANAVFLLLDMFLYYRYKNNPAPKTAELPIEINEEVEID